MVRKSPPGSRPGTMSLATIPTTRPKTIQPRTPMAILQRSSLTTATPIKTKQGLCRTRHAPCSRGKSQSKSNPTRPNGGSAMSKEQIAELLYQALETEKGGVQIYETAVRCAVNADLKEEWEEYLEQTEHHVEIVEGLFETFGLDPETDTPGRLVVRHIGESLVCAIEMAIDAGNADAAQIVAAECIALAETKDHLNWELMGRLAKKLTGDQAKALQAAHDEAEDE